MTEPLIVERPDGARLHVHAFVPSGALRGVVHVAHGMAEHGARYARFAAALNAAGFAAYADDHRGHGLTAPAGTLGHFADEDGFHKVADDLRAIRGELERRHRGVPIVYFGHSMGSFFGQYLLANDAASYRAFVLTGTDHLGGFLARAGRQLAKLERLRLGPRGKSALLTKASFGAFNDDFAPARTPFDWLSRDTAEVDKYIADPLCGFEVSTQLWVDLLGAFEEIDRRGFSAAPATTPVWLAAGSRDPVAKRGEGTRRLAERLHKDGLLRVRCTIYPDARHELLNETHRDEVTNDILAFLREQTA